MGHTEDDAVYKIPYKAKKEKISMFPVVHPKIAMSIVFFLFLILSIGKQQCAIFLSIEHEDKHTQTMMKVGIRVFSLNF